MIGIREQPQGGARAEPLDEPPEQLLVGELVRVPCRNSIGTWTSNR